jgi:hypothetical protein
MRKKHIKILNIEAEPLQCDVLQTLRLVANQKISNVNMGLFSFSDVCRSAFCLWQKSLTLSEYTSLV